MRVPPEGGCGSRLADLEGLLGGLFAMPLGAHRASRARAAFELVGAQVPQRGVQSVGVVPGFEEREDGHARFAMGVKRTPLQQLAFECGEQALGHRIVVAVARRASRRHHPSLPAPFAEGERGVLRPLDGMMDDPLGAALPDCHVQRLEHQLGAKMVGHRPPHHLAAEHIEHDGQVQEPRPGPDVGVGSGRSALSPFERWVSPARPPNRTCDSHRIRLSMCSCRRKRRPGTVVAPWCSFVRLASTRDPASTGPGHEAPVFTSGLLAVHQCCEHTGPLRHVHGFPVLGLLRVLRPTSPASTGDRSSPP